MLVDLSRDPLKWFLLERQKRAVTSVEVVRVEELNTGMENECLENAWKLKQELNVPMVSGCLYHKVKPYLGIFVQHWWNCDTTKNKHLDPNPGIESSAIHVLDLDLAVESLKKYNELKVYRSLACFRGQFFYYEGPPNREENEDHLKPISDLSTSRLIS